MRGCDDWRAGKKDQSETALPGAVIPWFIDICNARDDYGHRGCRNAGQAGTDRSQSDAEWAGDNAILTGCRAMRILPYTA